MTIRHEGAPALFGPQLLLGQDNERIDCAFTDLEPSGQLLLQECARMALMGMDGLTHLSEDERSRMAETSVQLPDARANELSRVLFLGGFIVNNGWSANDSLQRLTRAAYMLRKGAVGARNFVDTEKVKPSGLVEELSAFKAVGISKEGIKLFADNFGHKEGISMLPAYRLAVLRYRLHPFDPDESAGRLLTKLIGHSSEHENRSRITYVVDPAYLAGLLDTTKIQSEGFQNRNEVGKHITKMLDNRLIEGSLRKGNIRILPEGIALAHEARAIFSVRPQLQNLTQFAFRAS